LFLPIQKFDDTRWLLRWKKNLRLVQHHYKSREYWRAAEAVKAWTRKHALSERTLDKGRASIWILFIHKTKGRASMWILFIHKTNDLKG